MIQKLIWNRVSFGNSSTILAQKWSLLNLEGKTFKKFIHVHLFKSFYFQANVPPDEVPSVWTGPQVQVHPPAGHRLGRRVQIQVPQQVTLGIFLNFDKTDLNY